MFLKMEHSFDCQTFNVFIQQFSFFLVESIAHLVTMRMLQIKLEFNLCPFIYFLDVNFYA